MSDLKIKQCSKALLLFIKNPVLGKVKTRLAASVGNEMALEIYKKLLKHTRSIALEVKDLDRCLYYDQWIEEHDEWDNKAFSKYLQSNGDLGVRMAKAFEQSFKDGADKVVIIGSDCAQLRSSDIEAAFLALDHADVVFGPAKDGGYYLCGLRAFNPAVFHLAAWSTDTVLQESLELCSKHELSVSLLRSLSDIDKLEDWQQYGLK